MRIAVFTGSSAGTDPRHLTLAAEFAATLVRHDVGIVYGGAHVGLMGAVADTALRDGGEVIGVIPQSLVDREVAHDRLTDLHVVTSMHERKQLMADLSDVFVALPGGAGTLEEFFEAWTWLQLGLHDKPVALLNSLGFWTPMITALDQMVKAGFLKAHYRDALIIADDGEDLLRQVKNWTAPTIKW